MHNYSNEFIAKTSNPNISSMLIDVCKLSSYFVLINCELIYCISHKKSFSYSSFDKE